jgi:hypothetical protein
MTELNDLRAELLAKKQKPIDPASLDWNISDAIAAHTATVIPDAEPSPEPTEPNRLTTSQFEAMRSTQKLFGTAELSKRYPAWQIQEFLASRWNLEWQPTEDVKPLDLATIARTHAHRACSCETCGALTNAGYRHVFDDEHPRGAWLKIAEPRVSPVKVEIPLHPPAEMLPDCQQCDHYPCQNKRKILSESGYYFNSYTNGGEWRRLGG